MFQREPKNLFSSKQGFTLVEVLVAVAVGALIIILTYTSYSLAVRLTDRENSKIELVQNGRVVLDRLTREFRQALEIVTDLPEVNDDPLDPPAIEITFQDGHGAEPIRYLRYYLDNSALHRELSHYSFAIDREAWVHWSAVDILGDSPDRFIDDDEVIAEYVEDLAFWGGDRLLNISFQTVAGQDNVEFMTKVYGRNLR